MKYLGVDFGSKRVGLAVSDENGKVAFPYSVLKNSKNLATDVSEVIKKENISRIIVGESKDFKGNENPIAESARKFADNISQNFPDLKVEFEPEFLTSHQAEKIQGKNKMTDASAASIILQSFLDKENNQL